MNNEQVRPIPGIPASTPACHDYWKCWRTGPKGVVRPIVGPHSPFCEGPKLTLPLRYILKIVEPSSYQVISATKVAGHEEASAALKLLGRADLQPVLVSGRLMEFCRRTA